MIDDLKARQKLRAAAALSAAIILSIGSPSVAMAQAKGSSPAKSGLTLDNGMNALDKALAKADATPDQKTRIKAVVFDAFMSLGAQAPALKATMTTFSASLTTPHVDRAGLESARVSAVSEFDALSKVMVKAIGDAAEVLTPEQRAKLAASAKPKG